MKRNGRDERGGGGRVVGEGGRVCGRREEVMFSCRRE